MYQEPGGENNHSKAAKNLSQCGDPSILTPELGGSARENTPLKEQHTIPRIIAHTSILLQNLPKKTNIIN